MNARQKCKRLKAENKRLKQMCSVTINRPMVVNNNRNIVRYRCDRTVSLDDYNTTIVERIKKDILKEIGVGLADVVTFTTEFQQSKLVWKISAHVDVVQKEE